MKHIIYSLIFTTVLSACSQGSSPQSEIPQDRAQMTVPVTDTLVVTNGVVQPPFPGRDVSAGFFVLTNNMGSDDRLLSARSTLSESVEIHTHIKEDGVMKMRRIEGVDIPAGATVEFKPGGYHLMMFNSVVPEDAYFANITLVFEKSGEMTLTVPIDGREAPSYGSDHKGH